MTDTFPSWASLAATALARLRLDHAKLAANRPGRPAAGRSDRDDPRPRKMSEGRNLEPFDPQADPLDWLEETPAATQVPTEEGSDLHSAGDQGQEGPAVHVPATILTRALRLCATIGSDARLAEMMVPGAVTLIETGRDIGGMAPADMRLMLETAILPEEAEVVSPGRTGGAGETPDLCIVELAAEERETIRIRGDALHSLLRGLEAPCPVLVLAETLSQLPEDARRALPEPLRLAPLSRDIVLAVIAAHHGAADKDAPARRDSLPSDPVLARLSDAAWALALRAGTPRGIAARLSELTRPETEDGLTLADIEGYGEAEDAARRMVADLQGWADGRVAWTDVLRSVLLWGPPGTGKSHLARAMAGSAGVALVRGSFARWQAEGTLNHMLRAMRASFAEAEAARPAILVIDEIDAVGDRADPDRHSANYRQQVINAFLEALDSLSTIEGVMVVGTTNYPDKIDAAVLRPGRIDIKAHVPLPGATALARMIADGLGEDVPVKMMARLTRAATGQSAADIDGALRRACSAARAAGRAVTPADLLAALNPDPDEHNPARERRIAIHECGHAIVGTCLGLGRIKRVVLTRQGGQAWMAYATGEQMLADIEAELAYSLAGRAAERLILGDVAAGAGGNAMSDLALATQTATDIDLRFGLGAEGPVWLDMASAAYLRVPENAARIRARLEAAEARAIRILEERRDLLIRMAEDLVEVGLLEGERLEAWLEDDRMKILPAESRLVGRDAAACPDPVRSREIGNIEDGDVVQRRPLLKPPLSSGP